MRVADPDQRFDDVAVNAAQRVTATRFGELTSFAEFLGVQINDRITGIEQRERLGDVPQFTRAEIVVAVDEQHSLRTVVQAVIGQVQHRVADVEPRVRRARRSEVAPQGEEGAEVQHVSIAADPTRVGVVDVFADEGLQVVAVAVQNLAKREHVLGRAVQQGLRMAPVQRLVDVGHHPRLEMLHGVQAEPVDADLLHHPLQVSHQVTGDVLRDGVTDPIPRPLGDAGEGIHQDVALAGQWVEQRDRIGVTVRIKPLVGRIGDVRQSAEGRFGPRGDVPRIVRIHGVTNELVVGRVIEVDQARKPKVQIPGFEPPVEVPVDRIRQRDGEAGVSARFDETGRPGVAEPGVIQDPVDVNVDPGGVEDFDGLLQSRLGAIQRRTVGGSEIETVVGVVADREISDVGSTGRGQPNPAISDFEDIRCTVLDGLIGRIEDLDQRGCRLRREQASPFEPFQTRYTASDVASSHAKAHGVKENGPPDAWSDDPMDRLSEETRQTAFSFFKISERGPRRGRIIADGDATSLHQPPDPATRPTKAPESRPWGRSR